MTDRGGRAACGLVIYQVFFGIWGTILLLKGIKTDPVYRDGIDHLLTHASLRNPGALSFSSQ